MYQFRKSNIVVLYSSLCMNSKGTIWARETAVVSIGETRRFHLRATDKTRLGDSDH